jgi:hypothetical protein
LLQCVQYIPVSELVKSTRSNISMCMATLCTMLEMKIYKCRYTYSERNKDITTEKLKKITRTQCNLISADMKFRKKMKFRYGILANTGLFVAQTIPKKCTAPSRRLPKF